MSVKQALLTESSNITGQPVKIPFEFADLSSLPDDKKPGDSIVIKPITVRTWFSIKPLLVLIEQSDLNNLIQKQDSEFNSDLSMLMSKYDNLLFDIVCMGIHNKKGYMPDWFKNVLKDNCTWEDIYIILNAILFRLGGSSFLNSITALKAVSPLSEREIIALQKNKEKWGSKAASLY